MPQRGIVVNEFGGVVKKKVLHVFQGLYSGVNFFDMSVTDILLIGMCALIAWVLIELFVNLAHGLSRKNYIFWHYLVVVLSFGGLFFLYFFFAYQGPSIFSVMLVAMIFVWSFEIIVFRFLYSGERWFLNWVDWIFPMFLAASAIYAVGFLFFSV